MKLAIVAPVTKPKADWPGPSRSSSQPGRPWGARGGRLAASRPCSRRRTAGCQEQRDHHVRRPTDPRRRPYQQRSNGRLSNAHASFALMGPSITLGIARKCCPSRIAGERISLFRDQLCRMLIHPANVWSRQISMPAIGWWSRIRLATAGSSDAISMPVDSASPHALRASRPCRPAG